MRWLPSESGIAFGSMSEATGAMQQFNEPSAPNKGGGAGLLLLYAEDFRSLPTAWPITTWSPMRAARSPQASANAGAPATAAASSP